MNNQILESLIYVLYALFQVHADEFPQLSAMAKDFLAVAGSGVPVESLFPKGPDLLSHRRLNMKADTIKQCICLKSWLKFIDAKCFGDSVAEKMCGV